MANNADLPSINTKIQKKSIDILKSKEPPQAFVQQILVSYICSFKGLHQPNPFKKENQPQLQVGPMSMVKLA